MKRADEDNDALLRIIRSTTGSCGEQTTGVLFLIIPAFSDAMSESEFPRNSVWSQLMLVITDTAGCIILVASSLPPMPTSTTTQSTCLQAKYRNAIAVTNSKNVGSPV